MRRFWWVGLTIFVVAVVGISAISAHSNKVKEEQRQIEKAKKLKSIQGAQKAAPKDDLSMTPKELAKAQQALAQGIYIRDQEHDFSLVEKGFDLPIFDLKSVTIGVDHDYLFLKFQLFQNFNEQRVVNGSTITGTGFNANLLVDKNLKVKTPYGTGESTMLNASVTFDGNKLVNNAMYLVNIPNGQPESQWQSSGSFGKMDVRVAGGVGHDWLMMRAPLKGLGLILGEKVRMSFGTETASTTEYHLALDPLMGYQKTKCGANINFALGETKYTLDYKGCAGSGSGSSEPIP